MGHCILPPPCYPCERCAHFVCRDVLRSTPVGHSSEGIHQSQGHRTHVQPSRQPTYCTKSPSALEGPATFRDGGFPLAPPRGFDLAPWRYHCVNGCLSFASKSEHVSLESDLPIWVRPVELGSPISQPRYWTSKLPDLRSPELFNGLCYVYEPETMVSGFLVIAHEITCMRL